MLQKWKSYFLSKQNQFDFSLTLVSLVIILIILPRFLAYIETRDGIAFNDPLLMLFQPVNLTWFTFAMIYLALIVGIIQLLHHPNALVIALKTYTITVTFRIAAMYFLPLNPPSEMILLNDPFVQFFGSGEILTKDLFFSGHTSTLFILFLTAQAKTLRLILLLSTILVAAAVLLQHVHYTIDVFAAPFFAFAAYRISIRLENRNTTE